MALQSHEDYVRLNEHLWELDHAAKAFAELNSYDYGPPLTNGLYPKLRLWRNKDGISQNILFEMELNERKERYDTYFERIPYSVSANSWIDNMDTRVRHHGPYSGIRLIPFCALRNSFCEILKHLHVYNETVTSDLIYACDRRTPIQGHPLMGIVRNLE